jgi:hypothetical protein
VEAVMEVEVVMEAEAVMEVDTEVITEMIGRQCHYKTEMEESLHGMSAQLTSLNFPP